MIENSNLKLYVYESEGITYEIKSVIERPIYVEYNLSCNSGTSFKITAQRTQQNAQFIAKGDVIWIELDIIGVITYIKDNPDGTISIGGTLGETLLAQRAIFDPIEVESKSAGTVITEVYQTLTPILGLSISADTSGDSISMSVERGNFLEFVNKTCQNNGLNYTIRKSSASSTASQMELVFNVFRGVDKTDSVIISRNFGVIQDFEYTVNTADEINFVRVIGENDISVNVFTEEGASSTKVKEYVLDCTGVKQDDLSQEDYEAILRLKGQEVINEHQRKETFSGSYTGQTYVFHQDFDLGDKVSVVDTERVISTAQQVTGFSRQFDTSGVYSKLTFGQIQNTLPTMLTKLVKKTEALEDTVYNKDSSGEGTAYKAGDGIGIKTSKEIYFKAGNGLVLNSETGNIDGVGEWLDPDHTTERFNDYTNQGGNMKYCHFEGQGNTIIYLGEAWSQIGCNTVSGQSNRMFNAYYSDAGGQNNQIGDPSAANDYSYGVFVRGTRNTSKNDSYTVVLGSDNTSLNNGWSVIAGHFNTVSGNTSSLVVGDHNTVTDYGGSIVGGSGNTVSEGDCGCVGTGNVVSENGAFVCGNYGVTPGTVKFAVGNSNPSNPGNVFQVTADGHITITGDVTIAGTVTAKAYKTSSD